MDGGSGKKVGGSYRLGSAPAPESGASVSDACGGRADGGCSDPVDDERTDDACPLDPAIVADVLRSFGLRATGAPRALAGGDGGLGTLAVDTTRGPVVVSGAGRGIAADRAQAATRLAAALARSGAPVPRPLRSTSGWVFGGVTVREFVPGRPARRDEPHETRRCGEALGLVDRALRAEDPAPLPGEDEWLFTLAKDPAWVRSACLPLLDERFPAGYLAELLETLAQLDSALAGVDPAERRLAHVDPNPGNAIVGPDGSVAWIDLTPERREPGYALGAAAYWWALPPGAIEPDLAVLPPLAAGYHATADLAPRFAALAPAYVLEHSLLELAFPLACLALGPPPGARPLERLPERLARHARLRAALPELAGAIGVGRTAGAAR
jgi:Ser/Thr protein kinase RdoA (MazF antagonist)